MTLDEAKILLKENNLEFSICEYDNESDYLKHIHLYPDFKYAQECRVKAIVIKCDNGYKDLELQFNEENGDFIFTELLFGEFSFEMYDCEEEFLVNDLMFNIFQVLYEQIAIIVNNDIDKKKWIEDLCFNLDDDDLNYGEPAFFRSVLWIQTPKSALAKKFTTRRQYEIYTANSYQCIVK